MSLFGPLTHCQVMIIHTCLGFCIIIQPKIVHMLLSTVYITQIKLLVWSRMRHHLSRCSKQPEVIHARLGCSEVFALIVFLCLTIKACQGELSPCWMTRSFPLLKILRIACF